MLLKSPEHFILRPFHIVKIEVNISKLVVLNACRVHSACYLTIVYLSRYFVANTYHAVLFWTKTLAKLLS